MPRPHFARGRPFVARNDPIGASRTTLAQPRPNSSPGCPALLPAGRPAFSGVRQDPCRGTVVSLSLDPGCAQHPRWDDAADRDGTVTGVRCARRAPFRGRRCSWSLDVTSSSYARLFLPRRRVLRTRRSPVPVAHRRLLPGRCVRRARARVPTALLRLPSLVTPASARRYDPLTEETSRG
jgi:hypothetical protein